MALRPPRSSSPSSSPSPTSGAEVGSRLFSFGLLVVLAACGHSQPDKDYGSSSGSGGPPPAGGKGNKAGAGGSCPGAGGGAGAVGKAGNGADAGTAGSAGCPRVLADGPISTDAACKALEKRFDELLPQVLSCTVGTTKCDAKFRDRLACGCDIFIATEDFNGVALIQGVINDWDNAKCGLKITCPDVDCRNVVSGSCVAAGDLGVCTTK